MIKIEFEAEYTTPIVLHHHQKHLEQSSLEQLDDWFLHVLTLHTHLTNIKSRVCVRVTLPIATSRY